MVSWDMTLEEQWGGGGSGRGPEDVRCVPVGGSTKTLTPIY